MSDIFAPSVGFDLRIVRALVGGAGGVGMGVARSERDENNLLWAVLLKLN